MSESSRRAVRAARIAILVLPFALFHWMVPFAATHTLGNDYQRYAIDHQLELMFSLANGTYPLFVPGFAGGQSASALPQAELLHPHAQLARLLPGYWGGHALDWNTLLRLLELGLAHLLLLGLLLELGLQPMEALAVSMVTVYNLRMLDLFRYSAALESWTGHLYLCVAIGWQWLRPSRLRGPLLIAAATYWLACGGKTQMVLYGFVASGLFTLVLPFVVAAVRPERPANRRRVLRFWLATAVSCGVGLLLAAAFILPFAFDFLANGTERVGADYAWVTEFQDTVAGTLDNLVLPLRSEVHGAFGGSSLFLVALLVPLLRPVGVRLPRVVWSILAIIALVLLYMLGSHTPFHRALLGITPFGSAMRCPGRLSQVLPLLLMLLLVWVLRAPPLQARLRQQRLEIDPRTLLAGLAAVVTAGWAGLAGPYPSAVESLVLTPGVIHPLPTWLESAVLVAGLVTLVALAACGRPGRQRFAAEFTLCMAVAVHLALLLRWGTWVEAKRDKPTFATMLAQKRERLAYQADVPGYGLASRAVLRQATDSFLEPFLGKVYHRSMVVKDQDEGYRVMARGRRPDQVVLETPAPQLPAPNPGEAPLPDRVELVWSSFNRLVFAVDSSGPGYFGLAYPYSGHWRAMVNGRQAVVGRANGAAHAVAIPAGRSRIELRYHSRAAAWGMAVTCVTAALIGLVVAWTALSGRRRIVAGVAVLALAGVLFGLWRHDLYAGTSLGSRYVWTPDQPERLADLVYGRPTRASCKDLGRAYVYLHAASAAVDGDRSRGSGFISCQESRPWWEADLVEPQPVGSVVLFEGGHGADLNQRPLLVELSLDGNGWRTFPLAGGESPLRLELPEATSARYLRVRSSGDCRLSLDEVEVYPP